MNMKKKVISVVLLISVFLILGSSCGGQSNMDDKYLANINKYYRDNGMKSWWDILAVYNSGENPIDYKGYDEIIANLNGEQYAGMASYMIVAGVSADIGAQIDYYEEIENYLPKLISLLETSDGSQPINLYCFAFYALKSCNIEFDEFPFAEYIKASQLDRGGYTLSRETGDTDTTSLILPILCYMKENNMSGFDMIYENALRFIESGISENGTFVSYGKENANSTATALSALICAYKETDSDVVKKAKDGLALFTIKSSDGFAFQKDGKRNDMATNQAAIALGDLKNKSCLFYNILRLNKD